MNTNTMKKTDLKTSVTGVDLGSLNIKVAAVEKGVVDIITNQANLRQTPSVVGFGQKQRLIGQAGYVKMKSNFANTIVAPQRYLGFTEASEYIKEESKHASCQPKLSENGLIFKAKCQGKAQELTPEQATAALFNKINSIIKLNKLNNKFQVVAIPNYLSQPQRQALLDSIKISRDSVNENYGYQLITESTAIGFDYGFYKMKDFPEKEEDAPVVLFVDFGHSKLSLYAMKFTKNYQKVIYEKHLRQLGCKNIDKLMFQFYASLFEKENPNMEVSVQESKRAVLKLFESIEKQRKVLSGNNEYDFNIDCLLQDNDFSYSMKRQEFEKISEPVLTEIAQFFNQFKEKLIELGVTISHIELVGGGSRIPCFIKQVSSIFEIEPSRTLNSNECIARGAALCSAMQSSLFRVKQCFTFDVNSVGLSCFWQGQGESIEDQGNKATLVSVNQTIFSEKKVQLNIKPSKQKMIFSINSSEGTPGVNYKICSFSIKFPEVDEQQMQERKIGLTLKFDSNKLVQSVTASLMGEKEEPIALENLVFSQKLSKDQLVELTQKERQFVEKDLAIISGYEQRNKLQSQLYASKEKLNNFKTNNSTKDFVDPAKFDELSTFFQEIENSLDEINDYSTKTDEIQRKINEFASTIQNAQIKYSKVEQQIQKLSEFIEAAVSGKIRSIKYYPGEQVEKVKQWINNSLQQINAKPKFLEPELTVEKVQEVTESLKEKIEECQAEQLRKEEQEQRQYYQRQRQQPMYNPFASPNRNYNTPRRGRTTSFNPYGSGFFSDFGGFF